MKKNQLMRTILTVALATTMAFALTACGSDSSAEVEQEETQEASFAEPDEVITAGYGDNYVDLTIVISTGESFGFELSTEQDTVGDAMEVEGMVVLAEDGTVATALGIEATDETTWNLYVDGTLSATSAKVTPIEEGVSYILAIE